MCENPGKEPQVPPLRFAPVGMTILSRGQVFIAEAFACTTDLSSRPERSAVEGPAVLSRVLTHALKALNLFAGSLPRV